MHCLQEPLDLVHHGHYFFAAPGVCRHFLGLEALLHVGECSLDLEQLIHELLIGHLGVYNRARQDWSHGGSIDDVCTAVSRTLLPTPPTRSANTCAARAPLHLSLTATSVHLKRELTANELAFDGADLHSIGANQQ